jgi:hypothetical protein
MVSGDKMMGFGKARKERTRFSSTHPTIPAPGDIHPLYTGYIARKLTALAPTAW